MLNKRCAFEGNTPVRGYGSLPAQDGIFLPAGCADRSKSKNPATQTECAGGWRLQMKRKYGNIPGDVLI